MTFDIFELECGTFRKAFSLKYMFKGVYHVFVKFDTSKPILSDSWWSSYCLRKAKSKRFLRIKL